MNYNSCMIILIGASASGKTATALELAKKYKLFKAVTTTTREKRINENDGIDYYFVSKEEFLNKKNNNLFVETTIYNNNYYGCGIDQIKDDKVIVLDPNGYHSFLKLKNKNIVSFLILCDENKRKERMISRGDKEEKIKERLLNDINDFDINKIGKTDFVIDTSFISIEEAADKIYKLYIEKINKN